MSEYEATNGNFATGRDSYPPEKSIVLSHDDDEEESADAANVAEVTMALPWTTWMVVFACAMWDLTISGTQITCLFWS